VAAGTPAVAGQPSRQAARPALRPPFNSILV